MYYLVGCMLQKLTAATEVQNDNAACEMVSILTTNSNLSDSNGMTPKMY